MKRPLEEAAEGEKRKRKKEEEEWQEMEEDEKEELEEFRLDEDLLFEVFKHMDARTLGTAACVSRQWHRTAGDERLWEIICTRYWANTGCSMAQLRSVVLALGGFRRLHSLYVWPLLKPPPSISSSPSSFPWPLPISNAPVSVVPRSTSARWGKDEVNLSLSLLSIRYFEKMNPGTSQQRHHLPYGGGGGGGILQAPKPQFLEDAS